MEYSGSHNNFLDLDITIGNGKISTKLHDKRDDFFFVVCMPNFHGNIPISIFYGSVMPAIFLIARSSSVIIFMKKPVQ